MGRESQVLKVSFSAFDVHQQVNPASGSDSILTGAIDFPTIRREINYELIDQP